MNKKLFNKVFEASVKTFIKENSYMEVKKVFTALRELYKDNEMVQKRNYIHYHIKKLIKKGFIMRKANVYIWKNNSEDGGK